MVSEAEMKSCDVRRYDVSAERVVALSTSPPRRAMVCPSACSCAKGEGAMPAQVEPAILPAQASHEYSLSQLSDGLAKAPLHATPS
jgi:hypothetical protein